MPFFSIIIPIFNISGFIERGMKSLLSQTFKDFEIIMVDDGSTDDSGDKIDKLKELYPDIIKVFHQKNSGSGPARTKGIKEAKGKYLAFFDIDDEIYPNWLEDAHKYLIKYEPQILISGYEDIITYSKEINNREFEFKLYETNDAFKKDYVDKISGIKFHNGFVWNKIYEREFIIHNGFKFPSLKIQQDEVFNLSIYPQIQKVLTVPDIWYKYYVYSKGNTRSHYISERLNIYKTVRDSFLNLNLNWIKGNRDFEKYIYKRFYNSVFDVVNFNLFHSENKISKKARKKFLSNIFNDEDIIQSIIEYKRLGLKPDGFFPPLYFKAIDLKSPLMFLLLRKTQHYFHKILNR